MTGKPVLKELQDFEHKEAREKHLRNIENFGLAFAAQNEIDRQRLHHTRRLGGLPSSQLSLEVFESRHETIEWTDTLNQPGNESQISQPPYRIIQSEMI